MKTVKITHCKYELKFNYFANEDGTIYSEKTNKILSPQLDKNGYEKVQMISIDGARHRYSVHRLILENFNPVENMENLQVNHIDGNKRNNSLSNLEWCTCKENVAYAIIHNLRADQKGDKNPAAILSETQVLGIIERLKNHDYRIYHDIAKDYGVSDDYIGQIKRKERWKYLTEDINFN